MQYDRRQFISSAASFALCFGTLAPSRFSQEKKGTRVILLGTKGGPRLVGGLRNPSTLLLINDTPYVVDCGYGTSQQLIAAGVPLNKVRYLFITQPEPTRYREVVLTSLHRRRNFHKRYCTRY